MNDTKPGLSRKVMHAAMDRQVSELVVASTMAGHPHSRRQLAPMLRDALAERLEAVVRAIIEDGAQPAMAFGEAMRESARQVLDTVTQDGAGGLQ